mgnify:CR=1 FL=1
MEFTPHGVCSKNIHLEVDEAGRIHNVEFTGGCNGNLWIPQAGTCFISGRPVCGKGDLRRYRNYTGRLSGRVSPDFHLEQRRQGIPAGKAPGGK